jgi:hypothetical protein
MGFMQTSIIGTDPLGDLLGGEDSGRFDHGPFPMGPLGFDGVQSRIFTRQPTRDDAYATPRLFDVAVVATEPSAHLLTGVP